MKKKFIDPLIKRKAEITKKIQFYKKNIPLPSVVEISESGTCNRTCSFCPKSDPKIAPDTYQKMTHTGETQKFLFLLFCASLIPLISADSDVYPFSLSSFFSRNLTWRSLSLDSGLSLIPTMLYATSYRPRPRSSASPPCPLPARRALSSEASPFLVTPWASLSVVFGWKADATMKSHAATP